MASANIANYAQFQNQYGINSPKGNLESPKQNLSPSIKESPNSSMNQSYHRS